VTFFSVALMSFGLIFAAELGDKTQLMVLTLALRYGGRPVLLGAFLAFALLSGSAAIVGKGFSELISPEILTRVSGWVFIAFGVYMLLRKKDEGDDASPRQSNRAGVLAAFSLIAISEMGDKTQIATLLLSVKYQNFTAVFLGSLAALTLATVLGVFLAGRLHKFIPQRYVAPLSGFLFIILGLSALIML
jgi:Ca2+/H+ antiporter, TMEM165/GDT1 family